MIGIFVNALCTLLGGIFGTFLSKKISHSFFEKLNNVFGICSIGMGVWSVALMKNMTPVIFSLIFGSAIGSIFSLEKRFSECGKLLQKPLSKFSKKSEDDSLLVTTLVLFCASATGIYGCLDAGMSGNCSILLSKSVLDFFTAIIFACSLGAVVSAVACVQIAVFIPLFFLARLIVPLTNESMILDFKACGGFILIATGFRIAKIREFSIADMIPSMIFVMPCSYLWTRFIEPLLV